ncbi:HesA/MoeB/ThiF family protein (plasmid) [Haloferax sp. S1W]|uniref:HesA/MoeB/ThiF family protein n=1 Tax=Haloferax sp. S1W TaxID=3377110 RepID=UPI0037C830B1
MPLRLRPSANAFYLGPAEEPTAFVVIDGGERHTYGPLSSADRRAVDHLVRGETPPKESEIIAWLIENGLAENGAVDERGLPIEWPVRWSRQLSAYALYEGVTDPLAIHEQVTDAHALVVGLGGIGCHAVQQLAAIGVNEFTLVDPDRVERHNLNRQILYRHDDVGELKVNVAARTVRHRAAPDDEVSITAVDADFFDWEPKTAAAFDVAFVTADERSAGIRRRTSRLLYPAAVPYGFAAYSGQQATLGPLVFRTDRGCGTCGLQQIPVEDGLTSVTGPGTHVTPPSSAARNGLLGATLVDRWLRSLASPDEPHTLVFDMESLSAERRDHVALTSCPVCGGETDAV